jgi:hypothetical protein
MGGKGGWRVKKRAFLCPVGLSAGGFVSSGLYQGRMRSQKLKQYYFTGN